MSGANRKRRFTTVALCALVLIALVANMSACSVFITQAQATDLMDGIKPVTVTGKTVDAQFTGNTANFSLDLLRRTAAQGENTLISPLSVLLALAMTANGARGQTLEQMERVLGNDIARDALNEYLYTYAAGLPSTDKSVLKIANSIWFRDDGRLQVEQDFLQTNADYYGADAYKSAFDAKTLDAINDWVDKNTDGMIDKILDEISDDAVMYLLNAIVFDAEWETVYNKEDVRSGDFNAPDGVQTVDFMHSEERIYLDDGQATGFIKPYAGGDYSFVALLPNEGVAIGDYIASLTGEGFLNTLSSAEQTLVSASLPKFSYDFTVKMNDMLSDMGMPDAFSGELADFKDLGTSSRGNIYIGEVLHKTFISVDELGTKAGAVTKVEMVDEAAYESKTVRLDRPFIYAIIDNATNLPVFIGIVMNPSND